MKAAAYHLPLFMHRPSGLCVARRSCERAAARPPTPGRGQYQRTPETLKTVALSHLTYISHVALDV